MSNRYRLAVYVEFVTVDDSAARLTVTRNMDVLSEVATALHGCAGTCFGGNVTSQVKLKLQRLNDDAPPRSLLVETL